MTAIPFFVVTRIGLGVHCQSYYDRILPLFEAVTMPSLLAQTNRDFHWLIAVDGKIPALARERLEQVTRPHRRIHLVPVDMTFLQSMRIACFDWFDPFFRRVTYGKGLIACADDYALTALIDCDDAWHHDTVSLVQKSAEEMLPKLVASEPSLAYLLASSAGALITLPYGLKWFPLLKKTEPVSRGCMSLSIFVLSRSSSGTYAFTSRHAHWPEFAKVVNYSRVELITPHPMWLQTKHQDNLTSNGPPVEGSHADDESLQEFGVDTEALKRWRHIMLEPHAFGKNEAERHTTAFRQYTRIQQITARNQQIAALLSELQGQENEGLKHLLQSVKAERQALVVDYLADAQKL